MSKIPRPLLVFIVLALGTLGIYTFKAPHSPCDSQKDVFIGQELGLLFTKPTEGIPHAPQYLRFRESCRTGSTPGACFEYFDLLQKIVRDLDAVAPACAESFQEIPELQRAFNESIEIFTNLAWGDSPPEAGVDAKGALSFADVSRFCRVKNLFRRIWGDEALANLQFKIFADLPGEGLRLDDKHQCENCENRKKASSILSNEEVWSRSIFSLPCEKFE